METQLVKFNRIPQGLSQEEFFQGFSLYQEVKKLCVFFFL
jgi:hypothetical protein